MSGLTSTTTTVMSSFRIDPRSRLRCACCIGHTQGTDRCVRIATWVWSVVDYPVSRPTNTYLKRELLGQGFGVPQLVAHAHAAHLLQAHHVPQPVARQHEARVGVAAHRDGCHLWDAHARPDDRGHVERRVMRKCAWRAAADTTARPLPGAVEVAHGPRHHEGVVVPRKHRLGAGRPAVLADALGDERLLPRRGG
jgi:hypothetical protein